MEASDEPAPQHVSAKQLVQALHAAFKHFMSQDLLEKTLLAAGIAAGIEEVALRAELESMGALAKPVKGKKKQRTDDDADKRPKKISAYSFFCKRYCAQMKAQGVEMPEAAEGERKKNSLTFAIASWRDGGEALHDKFRNEYADLIKVVNERVAKGEKISDAELLKETLDFEKKHKIKPVFNDALLNGKRKAEAPVASTPSKKAKAAPQPKSEPEPESDAEPEESLSSGEAASESEGDDEGDEKAQSSESCESEDEPEPVKPVKAKKADTPKKAEGTPKKHSKAAAPAPEPKPAKAKAKDITPVKPAKAEKAAKAEKSKGKAHAAEEDKKKKKKQKKEKE